MTKMKKNGFRIEKDSLGEVRIPSHAYWGPETQRAVDNFAISNLRFPSRFIRALGMIKKASALANTKFFLLPKHLGQAIGRASQEVMDGKLDDQFPVDIFQTGSGTSTNMNANEVIANRASEILGGKIGDRSPVHPHDHVNLGQSSNDVIPSCIHIAALEGIKRDLIPQLKELQNVLEEKAEEFDAILKIGRTHLQDAIPIRMGQEFGGYAAMVKHSIPRMEKVQEHLAELAIGGTAVGTGVNTHPQFAKQVIAKLNEMTGLAFKEAENHFEAQGAKDAVVEASAVLKTLAVSLMKIANDIRWLGSGPRCAIGEIILPAVQPGSSMMPGKVNPVIPEALCQVAAQVVGNDTTIAIGGMSGNFELNVMMPVMAYNLLQSITLLTHATSLFSQKCIRGLKADQARCQEMIEKSLAMVTVLSPRIGYDAAAQIAQEAYDRGKTIREIALEKKVLPEKELFRLLDPRTMTEPGRVKTKPKKHKAKG
jgi:fumarate hydratase, class II